MIFLFPKDPFLTYYMVWCQYKNKFLTEFGEMEVEEHFEDFSIIADRNHELPVYLFIRGGNKTVTAAITFLCNVHNLCQSVSPPGESNNMDVMKYEGTGLRTLNDQDSSTVGGNRIRRWELYLREKHTVWWSGLLKVCFYPRAITRSIIWPTNHPLT